MWSRCLLQKRPMMSQWRASSPWCLAGIVICRRCRAVFFLRFSEEVLVDESTSRTGRRGGAPGNHTQDLRSGTRCEPVPPQIRWRTPSIVQGERSTLYTSKRRDRLRSEIVHLAGSFITPDVWGIHRYYLSSTIEQCSPDGIIKQPYIGDTLLDVRFDRYILMTENSPSLPLVWRIDQTCCLFETTLTCSACTLTLVQQQHLPAAAATSKQAAEE